MLRTLSLPAAPLSPGRSAAARFVPACAAAAFFLATLPALADPFADGLQAYDGGDYRAAATAWRPLAEAGDAEAQTALAGLLMDGHGVPRDPSAAAAWYRRAAEHGHAVAQLNLGDLYARGWGVSRDPVEAYVWLGLAALQGRDWAVRRQTEVAETMSAAEIAAAERLIAERKAAP